MTLAVRRRWTALAGALAAAGWLSTLTPAATGGVLTMETSTRVVPPQVVKARPASRPLLAAPAVPAAPAAPPRKIDCAKRKCVALTFDDGPMSSTVKLLKILKARKVRVTFFVVGQAVKARPGLVRQELADGHELANHSYSHADLGRSSTAKITSEISRTQTAVRQAAGVTPVLFRPPYGSTDKQVAAVARRYKLAQILWTVDPNDWRDRNAATVQRRVVNGTRPGYIVLMHDIHKTTVDAVPGIITKLAKKGYIFVTVSELYGKPLVPGKKYTKR